ncbi:MULTISPECIES: flavodoxin [unclassified Ruminococcus]|uniref:flavodoxin n=1 Tax=unclassified Ruminococcus TaxID=2608920 RepID=UPI00210CCE00|nr:MULTISPECIES: flavodoxin [unclassified Ruminococcus]MCQ4022377.1 flavodoxin [Ruminococcus sp. zg-924]MCQ4114705.1 flavodoxin [Ruminococcus sp. zg-921]
MKTLIICESTHHGNTKKLCDAITADEKDVTLWENGRGEIPWEDYDLIGFASGIAFNKFYPAIIKAAESIPAGKLVFFLYTCGKNSQDFSEQLAGIVEARGCTVLGSYGCKGFDTYGPFKLIGGINKGHPDRAECDGAVKFYRKLKKD